MDLKTLNEKLQQLGELLKEERDSNDQRLKALENNEGVSELEGKLAKMDERYEELETTIGEIEKGIAEKSVPTIARDGEVTEAQAAHKKAFCLWIRNPEDADLKADMQRAQKAALAEMAQREGFEEKAVLIGTDSAGGYAVPEVIGSMIHEKIVEQSPLWNYVRTVEAGTSDYKELVDVGGEAFGWVGEGDTRSETGTAQLEEVAPTFGSIYAYPKASEESLQDVFFNVEDWIVNRSSRGISRGIGQAIISGNGTKKPTGFLNGTPVSTGDEDSPARAFGTLQYVPSGGASGFAASNPADAIIDLEGSVKSGYKDFAHFYMNRATQSAVRKFKDGNGEYIWERSMQAGMPNQLLGYDVVETPDMPAVGANAFPIAFGNMQEAYLLVYLASFRVTRDEVTQPGFVKFYVRRRLGGKLLNDDALKLLKCATS